MIDPAALPSFQAILPHLRRGRGRCLLCDSRTGFSASEQKGIWHCFACGDRGDKITLIQKMHGCTFKDALTYLGIDGGPLPKVESPYKRNEHIREWANKLGKKLRDDFFTRERMIFNAWQRLKLDPEDEQAWHQLQDAFHLKEKLEWLLDRIDIGTIEQRQQIYKQLGGQKNREHRRIA